MLTVAIIVLALAALGGATLAGFHLSARPVPWSFSIGHGVAGGAGLILLTLAALQGSGGVLTLWALGLLVAAAAGGLFMAAKHRSTGTRPSAVVIIHGLIALAAIGLLAVAVLA